MKRNNTSNNWIKYKGKYKVFNNNYTPYTSTSLELNKMQMGGEFPDATTYSQLGTLPNNKFIYTPSTMKKKIGRPSYRNYSNALFQKGGNLPTITVRPDNRSQQLILSNMDKPMVKRMFNPNAPSKIFSGNTKPSTHIMSYGSTGDVNNPSGFVVYPTVIQDKNTGELRYADDKETFKTNEIYLPVSKGYDESFAKKFSSTGYKQAVNDLQPWLGGKGFHQKGGTTDNTKLVYKDVKRGDWNFGWQPDDYGNVKPFLKRKSLRDGDYRNMIMQTPFTQEQYQNALKMPDAQLDSFLWDVVTPPQLKLNKKKCGGYTSVNIKPIDKNDVLHPADSDRLSYRNDPIGFSMKISRSSGPHIKKFQSGGNVAVTESDYSEGLNKGKNIFQFPRKGLKKMTMNPPSGSIEYPVKMTGLTEGKVTDEKMVNPGEDVLVNGDTIVETPDLSNLDFNEAIDYANRKKLPIFMWNGNEYPMRQHMEVMQGTSKMQEGGLFSSKVTDYTKLNPGFAPDENIN